MGTGMSSPSYESSMGVLHTELMNQAGMDLDIGTASTITYPQLITYITELNKNCAKYPDDDACVLVFAVKKGTDWSLLWRVLVRIACLKHNTRTNAVQSYRLLSIRQFLQVFRRISYEFSDGSLGFSPDARLTEVERGAEARPAPSIPPTMAAALILLESSPSPTKPKREGESREEERKGNRKKSERKGNREESEVEECSICLEGLPDVVLPCFHSFCTSCIEEWWEHCKEGEGYYDDDGVPSRSCPLCRHQVSNPSSDTWVMPEAPDDDEMSQAIRRALTSYATTSSPLRGGAEGGAPVWHGK